MITLVDALSKLQDYYAQHRALPSYATLLGVFGLRSKSGVAKIVGRLREQCYLELTPDRRLAPASRFFERPLYGQVRAGLPDTGQNSAAEFLSIDSYLVPNPSRSSLVRVRGDSMKDAGLLDGDIVVIDCLRHAQRGDVVVALVDGEQTLKTLDTERGKFVLKPANEAYPVIRPQGSLDIVGIVTGSFRTYSSR